jgi:hypothetical protein
MLFPLSTLAEPISLRDAMTEFSNRGAKQLEGVLLSGVPVIKGTIAEQGFSSSMFECDGQDYTCRVVISRSCIEFDFAGGFDALKLANEYNLQIQPRGYALVSNRTLGSASLCVQVRDDLSGENRFDQSETFAWQQTVRDFRDFVEQAKRERAAQDLLEVD